MKKLILILLVAVLLTACGQDKENNQEAVYMNITAEEAKEIMDSREGYEERKMMIRKYRQTDCGELARLFYDTVHTVNAEDYTQEQLDAWATGEVDLEKWNETFLAHRTVVAELEGQIVGFGDMNESGYLDRLYVHKDYQRRGVATEICDELERNSTAAEFTTHASITARPFYEKRGYTVVKEQQVECRGVRLTNFVMKRGRLG